jgi:hypothetical protein
MRRGINCPVREDTNADSTSATVTAARMAHGSTSTGAKYVIANGTSAPIMYATPAPTPNQSGNVAGTGSTKLYSHSS